MTPPPMSIPVSMIGMPDERCLTDGRGLIALFRATGVRYLLVVETICPGPSTLLRNSDSVSSPRIDISSNSLSALLGALDEAVGVAGSEGLGSGRDEFDGSGSRCLVVVDGLGVGDGSVLGVGLPVDVGLPVAVGSPVGDGSVLGVGLPVDVGLPVAVGSPVGDGSVLGVGLPVAVGSPVGDGEGSAVGLGEGFGVGVMVGVGVEGVGVGGAVGDALGVGGVEGLGFGACEVVGLDVGVGVGLDVGVGVGLDVGVGVGVMVGVGVEGVGVGGAVGDALGVGGVEGLGFGVREVVGLDVGVGEAGELGEAVGATVDGDDSGAERLATVFTTVTFARAFAPMVSVAISLSSSLKTGFCQETPWAAPETWERSSRRVTRVPAGNLSATAVVCPVLAISVTEPPVPDPLTAPGAFQPL